jgi:hypothetical protein
MTGKWSGWSGRPSIYLGIESGTESSDLQGKAGSAPSLTMATTPSILMPTRRTNPTETLHPAPTKLPRWVGGRSLVREPSRVGDRGPSGWSRPVRWGHCSFLIKHDLYRRGVDNWRWLTLLGGVLEAGGLVIALRGVTTLKSELFPGRPFPHGRGTGEVGEARVAELV